MRGKIIVNGRAKETITLDEAAQMAGLSVGAVRSAMERGLIEGPYLVIMEGQRRPGDKYYRQGVTFASFVAWRARASHHPRAKVQAVAQGC